MNQFYRYTIPSVIGSLVTSLYLVIDGIFIAQGVGESAVAAVTLVLPLTMAFVSVSMIFSVGGSNLFSTCKGAGDNKRAVSIFRQSICLLTIIGIVFSVLGTMFADNIATLLGATGELKQDAAEYTKYYMLFTVPVLLATALSTFIRHDGSPKLSMYSMLGGAVTNIVLDYVFVFPLQMGLRGAAIATGLGQLVTVIVCLLHFAEHRGILRIGRVKITARDVKEIVVLGFPSFLTEVSYSVMMYLHNVAIVNSVGKIGVTAYGIVNYINNLSYMALLGIGQGIQPLISYYYGSGDVDKARHQYALGMRASVFTSVSFLAICFVAGKPIIRVFASSTDVIDLSYKILNYLNVAYILLGVNLTTQMYLQSMHMTWQANLICILRGYAFVKIGLAALPRLFGDAGIWATLLFSESTTFLVGLLIASYMSKNDMEPAAYSQSPAQATQQVSRNEV